MFALGTRAISSPSNFDFAWTLNDDNVDSARMYLETYARNHDSSFEEYLEYGGHPGERARY